MSHTDREAGSVVTRRGALTLFGVGSTAAVVALASAVPAHADPTDTTGTVHVVNVKDFGAVGDGTTDDDAAIHAAIDASAEGDAVFFPPGTYLVSSTLRPKAGQVYFASGDEATIKAKPGGTAFAMFSVTKGPIELHRLTLDLASDQMIKPSNWSTQSGIVVGPDPSGSAVVRIDDCTVKDAYGKGIDYDGGSGDASFLSMTRTAVSGCGAHAVQVRHATNASVDACRFTDSQHGVIFYFSHSFSVRGTVARANRGHGIGAIYCQDWHVDGCEARENGAWGIVAGGMYVDPPPPVNSDFTITNNVCADNVSGGITIDPTLRQAPDDAQDQRARVSGNVCSGAVKTHGINITHAKNVVATDNVCHHNKLSGIQLTSSAHLLAQGNACFQNAVGIGISSSATLHDPGYHVIGVNMLHDNGIDLNKEAYRTSDMLPGVRLYGLGGSDRPEGSVVANPGTLYEWHDGADGLLYVKAHGSGSTGWLPLKEKSGEPPR